MILRHEKGEYKIELPLDDELSDPRFDQLLVRKYEDPVWREEAKKYMLKKIEEAVIFNIVYKGQAEERVIDPVWITTLNNIDRLEKELAKHGQVLDYGIYQKSSDDSDSGNSKMIEMRELLYIALSTTDHIHYDKRTL